MIIPAITPDETLTRDGGTESPELFEIDAASDTGFPAGSGGTKSKGNLIAAFTGLLS